MSIIYRSATPADADAIADMFRQSFRDTFAHLYAPEDLADFLCEVQPRRLGRELADPRYRVPVAEHDGQAVGYVKLGPPEPAGRSPTAARSSCASFTSQGAARRAAIGAELMDWAIDEARRASAEELYLTVYVDNHRARRFYERYGFEEVGRYDFMVGEHADEDIVMRHVRCELTVEVIRAPSLAGVPHGFLGRRGGVSTGEVAGLNVGFGSKDDRAAIDENRRRAVAAVQPGARTRHPPPGPFGRCGPRASSAWPHRCDGRMPTRGD